MKSAQPMPGCYPHIRPSTCTHLECQDRSEATILQKILALLPTPAAGTSQASLYGPGDDAALLRALPSRVISTDALSLNYDWRESWGRPYWLGRKTIRQNASDMNAMGASLREILFVGMFPPDVCSYWLTDLVRGMAAELAALGAVVIGGDIGSADTPVLTVTALGEVEPERAICTRSGARPGDVLAIKGDLGRAAAGLRLLEAGVRLEEATAETAAAIKAQYHLHFPVGAGPQAAGSAHALIDISDGLAIDSARLARASGVDLHLMWATLQADLRWVQAALQALPIVAGNQREEAEECVARGGEDYALLGSFAPQETPSDWRKIGFVSPGTGQVHWED